MALLFEVNAGSPTPIYEQIEAQIRRAVASQRLREGDQLPSVRVLAEQLTVNPNTVARAYSELMIEGIVETRAGRGVFIAPRRQIFSVEERERRLEDALRRLLDDTAFLDIPLPQILRRLETLSAEYFHPPKNKPQKP